MEITSRKNELIRHLRMLSREKKERAAYSSFLIEGDKLCREAVKEKLTVIRGIATPNAMRRYRETTSMLAEISDIIVINEDLSEYISDTKSPQGIFAEVKIPSKFSLPEALKNKNSFLALDNLQDSGNVGSIIRTCDAFSIGGLLISESSADVYSPKTVRAAMGSLFRLPVFVGSLEEMLTQLRGNGFEIFGAMLDSGAEKLESNVFKNLKTAVVIGNEGNGISPETAGICTRRLYIPICGAESLNAAAAAAVIAWEINEQQNYARSE